MQGNNKRVAKNTLLLYIRMFVYMIVSLYTSRIVLKSLGVEDFGIFNVVGGVISMLGFLNASLTGATSRFITFALGKNDINELRKVFSSAINLHFVLAVIVVLIGETLGLWFLNTHINIPENRIYAANWIYQASLITCFLGISQMPYNSVIVAHERMNIYAYIGIVEVFFKLIIVYVLFFYHGDRLILYSSLLVTTSVLINIFYYLYCIKSFEECKYKLVWDKELNKELLSFSGWTLFSSLSWMCKGQGTNILLNIFGGPIVNASRGIAFQVNSAVKSFITNFSTAFNPQITKYYAAGQINELYPFINNCSKIASILLMLLSIPLIVETDYVLILWLGEIPEYVTDFTRLVLIESFFDAFSIALTFSISASGKIKKYQLINGIINVLNLPLSYVFLKYDFSPTIVFIISIFLNIINLIWILYCSKKIFNFPVKEYAIIMFKLITFYISLILVLNIFTNIFDTGIIRFFIICFVSSVLILLLSYLLVLNPKERNYIITLLKQRIYGTK